MSQTEKCGYVAIVGRPNVGKSTLLNNLIGKKISIMTPKPQTTRTQILGVKTIPGAQFIYIDTPGIHRTEQRAMNRYMNRLANAVVADADVIVFVIDARRWTEEDQLVLDKLHETKAPVILALNKVDLCKDKGRLLPLIDRLKDQFEFATIVPISAKKKDNLATLEHEIQERLPESPPLFPAEQVTDKPESFQAAEIIREKVIKATEQELPYTTTVVIESLERTEKLVNIQAIIWVEREGQKPIVIGKGGERLKKIGTDARKDLEVLFNQKVFLRLWVKVKDNWTDNQRLLQQLGYE